MHTPAPNNARTAAVNAILDHLPSCCRKAKYFFCVLGNRKLKPKNLITFLSCPAQLQPVSESQPSVSLSFCKCHLQKHVVFSLLKATQRLRNGWPMDFLLLFRYTHIIHNWIILCPPCPTVLSSSDEISAAGYAGWQCRKMDIHSFLRLSLSIGQYKMRTGSTWLFTERDSRAYVVPVILSVLFLPLL